MQKVPHVDVPEVMLRELWKVGTCLSQHIVNGRVPFYFSLLVQVWI